MCWLLSFIWALFCTMLPNCVLSPLPRNVLLCLNVANFFKQYLATPNFKHIVHMVLYMNMFSMRLKIRMTKCLKQKWHRLNTAKQTAGVACNKKIWSIYGYDDSSIVQYLNNILTYLTGSERYYSNPCCGDLDLVLWFQSVESHGYYTLTHIYTCMCYSITWLNPMWN